MTEEEQVIILEQGSPEAQKIAKAMASPAAGEVLNLLSGEGPYTATEIAEKLNIPLTSLKYHLENLLEAGLIEVVNTRWSEKGKRMKIYGAVEKDIILKPKKKSTTAKVVGKYGVAAGVAAIICAGIPLLSRIFSSSAPDATPTNDMVTYTASGPYSEEIPKIAGAMGENSFLTTTADSISGLTQIQINGIFLIIFLIIIAILTIVLLLRLSRMRAE